MAALTVRNIEDELVRRLKRRAVEEGVSAIALANGLTVVTRNVRDFAPMRVPTIDPWGTAEP